MHLRKRSILDSALNEAQTNLLRLAAMVDEAIANAATAFQEQDVALAHAVIANDREINHLRYELEQMGLMILATQQPAASDLRRVLSIIHIVIELERVADHAAGMAHLVERMQHDQPFSSVYKLPKMASRARRMISESVEAFVNNDLETAEAVIAEDNKMDKHYAKLVRHGMVDMHDDDYIRLANYLLWAGHALERIGDRATNIAERVIFTVTGHYPEFERYFTEALDEVGDLDEIDD